MKSAFLLIASASILSSPVCVAESAAFGAAAITAAAMPAVVAGIQSSNDKEVAKINAEAQKDMTDTVAANSVALAALSQGTTMYQTYMSLEAQKISQAGTTQRLSMQLATLEKLSMMTMDLKQMQFEAEMSLKMAYLDLKQRMIEAQGALAASQQQLELTKAGLSNGTIPQYSDLTITNSGMATGEGGDGALIEGGAQAFVQPGGAAAKLLNSVANTGEPEGALSEQVALSGLPSEAADEKEKGPAFVGDPRPIRTINAYAGEGSSAGSEQLSGEAVAVPFQYTE